MQATAAEGGTSMVFTYRDDDDQTITGADGRFRLKGSPRGRVTLRGIPKTFGDGVYMFLAVTKMIDGGTTVDVGDLPMIKKRLKDGEAAGELGLQFKVQPPDVALEDRKLEVSFIEPGGPAAKTAIEVGDVVTSVDGISVVGENAMQGYLMMNAPVGTTLALELARGTTVNVTLAAP